MEIETNSSDGICDTGKNALELDISVVQGGKSGSVQQRWRRIRRQRPHSSSRLRLHPDRQSRQMFRWPNLRML